jgi:hypothetical protein
MEKMLHLLQMPLSHEISDHHPPRKVKESISYMVGWQKGLWPDVGDL